MHDHGRDLFPSRLNSTLHLLILALRSGKHAAVTCFQFTMGIHRQAVIVPLVLLFVLEKKEVNA